jgi:AcrR family transcriptional regulator
VRQVTDTFSQYRSVLAAMPLREALLAYIAGGLEWGKEQAGFMQFFARAAYHAESSLSKTVVRPIANVLHEMVHEMLVQAAARGEIRPDVDLEATTRVIYALMIAVGDSQLLPYLNNYFLITDKKMSAERVIEAMVEMILNGIGLH